MKKREKILRKKDLPIISVLVVIAVIILMATLFEKNTVSSESVITRKFSKTKVNLGDQVTVVIDVSISDKDTFYAIEEYIPEGWKVIDAGDGGEDPNVLRWIVIQDIKDTTYTYIVEAQKGADNFNGIYMFETFTQPKTTSGDNTIIVVNG